MVEDTDYREKELKHISENTIKIDEYPKVFVVTSKPTDKGIEIYVSYKDNRKKLGLIQLEETDMLRDGKGYYLILGKGYSDSGFCFMQQEENFADMSFHETFGNRAASEDKQQIKQLLAPVSDFVEVGTEALLEIAHRFVVDETYYNYIHKEWHK